MEERQHGEALYNLAQRPSARVVLFNEDGTRAWLTQTKAPPSESTNQFDFNGVKTDLIKFSIAYLRFSDSAVLQDLVKTQEIFLQNVVFLGFTKNSASSNAEDERQPLFAVGIAKDLMSGLIEELKSSEIANGSVAFHDLRNAVIVQYRALDPADSSILGYGSQVMNWFKSCKFCSTCGGELTNDRGGIKKICTKETTSAKAMKAFYCRTDPSIIVVILNSTRDKILLVRSPRYNMGMYTCVSGFTDACETLENTIVREAMEETGLSIDPKSIVYIASQPWPYPRSIMIGFFAQVKAGDQCELKFAEGEIEDGMWCSPEEVKAALNRWDVGGFATHAESGKQFFVPPPTTLANLLISTWAQS
eukprot:TRINITY_DN2886_c0_g1_i1.p1 TRINITY_DN2886_c0_g1~~TRINITY_DN2886_c0_g1_i1.p1  ORF type:complete len:383 (+),score=97.69 TRINITY_DN2886_c0_g1_i1:64-1149(+)